VEFSRENRRQETGTVPKLFSGYGLRHIWRLGPILTRFPACPTSVYTRFERGRLSCWATPLSLPATVFSGRASTLLDIACLPDKSQPASSPQPFAPPRRSAVSGFPQRDHCSRSMASLLPCRTCSAPVRLSSPHPMRFRLWGGSTISARCASSIRQPVPASSPPLPAWMLLPADPGLAALIHLAANECARLRCLHRNLPHGSPDLSSLPASPAFTLDRRIIVRSPLRSA